MSRENLENLVRIRQLHRQPLPKSEFEGLVTSGKARLQDASRGDLSLESRFELA